MTVLTYRGKKYIQNKEVSQENEPVLLTYRGLEVMSKRIHEAATAEMGLFKLNYYSLKEVLRGLFFYGNYL
jgi:hypothetical protein